MAFWICISGSQQKHHRAKSLHTFISSILCWHGGQTYYWNIDCFSPDFPQAHLLFESPGIWFLSLFLERCLCVKQAVGLTYKSAQGGDWGRARLIYQWIICSRSKPLKCAVVTTDFPKGLVLRQRGEDREEEACRGGREPGSLNSSSPQPDHILLYSNG